jgi:DNA (cytosine-5)-methyltransferase 1
VNKSKNLDNRSVISLFSGAMGLDIGLEMAGLEVKIAQDIDMECAKTIRVNGRNVISGDIKNISAALLLKEANLNRGEPFLVCGGPPCQPFSTAGKRLGLKDPRGSLFMDFKRVIDQARPRFFIMENVKGLLSSTVVGGKARKEDMLALDIILKEFDNLGYATIYGLLDSVNYGAPQFRERLVLIGSRDGEDIFLPFPTHFQSHQNSNYRWATLRSAIADIEDTPGEGAFFSAARLELLKTIPAGGNWRNLPLDRVEKAMGGAFHSGGGKVGFYRRLSYDEPSPTLVTSPVQKASMLCHPTKDRPLSVREYARIQQFPDSWRFSGQVANKYRQIGNAVSVGLGRALGESLMAVVDGNVTVKTKRTRGTDVHNRLRKALELGHGHKSAGS